MQTFDKTKDFIFEIIHDLKAPLVSVDFALKNRERDELLDEIYRINKHNLNYVENMMSGYSISKGRYCPKYEIVNLVKIVKEELKVLSFFMQEKNLQTILSVDKLDDGYIISDKYLVRQIVLNLLTNAVKYTPVCGVIKVVFEKSDKFLSVCFSNPYNADILNNCSSKMGLEIIKNKLKALKGKMKVVRTNGNICFNVYFSAYS